MSQAALSAALRAALIAAKAQTGAIDDTPLTAFCDSFASAFWPYLSMVAGAGVFLTPEGGVAVYMTNKTGAASVKGALVECYDGGAVNRAFDLTATGANHAIGVVYEAGVADGSECIVVIAGTAECLIEAGDTIARGYWASTGKSTAGRVSLSNVPGGGSVADHFTEIGHCQETLTNTGSTLARCVIHFN
jgi:hypothetical protein